MFFFFGRRGILLYWCSYLHTSRDSVSPLCGICITFMWTDCKIGKTGWSTLPPSQLPHICTFSKTYIFLIFSGPFWKSSFILYSGKYIYIYIFFLWQKIPLKLCDLVKPPPFPFYLKYQNVKAGSGSGKMCPPPLQFPFKASKR